MKVLHPIEKRGGHNRKKFNTDFFKRWTAEMAYVLGYAFADGTLIDSPASRCCYLRFYSNDRELLEQVRLVLGSQVKIQRREPQKIIKGDKIYQNKPCYSVSIGSKALFVDLIRLGLKSDKSLDMIFPKVPERYLSFFIRGYFDGDGCVSITGERKRLVVVFTSGSWDFLASLANRFARAINVKEQRVAKSTGSYQLLFSTREATKVLDFMYRRLDQSPYLKRKYSIYQKWRGTQVDRGRSAKPLYMGSNPIRASRRTVGSA